MTSVLMFGALVVLWGLRIAEGEGSGPLDEFLDAILVGLTTASLSLLLALAL